MAKYNHYSIDNIKASLTIWKVLQSFGHEVAEKDGVIKSPMRPDKTPSFSISQGGKLAHDFSSGESWDVISLYQHLRGSTLHEAIVGCGEMAGLRGGEAPAGLFVPPPPPSRIPKTPSHRRETDSKTFIEKLPTLDDDLLSQMKMSAMLAIRTPTSHLSIFADSKGLTVRTIYEAIAKGMIGVLDHHLLNQPTIVFLFKDWEGNIGAKMRFDPLSSRKTIWWQGKARDFLFGDVATSKSELEDFERPPIFVLEGESDTLTVMQYGYPALGIVGAGIMPHTPKIHSYLSHRSVGIIYDSDSAGVENSAKLSGVITSNLSGSNVYNLTNSPIMGIKEGSDINEAMREAGVSDYKYNMKEAHDLLSQKKTRKSLT